MWSVYNGGLSCPHNSTFMFCKDRVFLARFEVLIVMLPNIQVLWNVICQWVSNSVFWRHQDPSKWWEPLAHWHSIKPQRTWIFQVFSVTFRALRVVSRSCTLLRSDTMYFTVWLQHAGITHCHEVEEYVICQKLEGMEVVCSQPQARSSLILVTNFPAQPDHLIWRWQQHQVPPTHQYLGAKLHGITF